MTNIRNGRQPFVTENFPFSNWWSLATLICHLMGLLNVFGDGVKYIHVEQTTNWRNPQIHAWYAPAHLLPHPLVFIRRCQVPSQSSQQPFEKGLLFCMWQQSNLFCWSPNYLYHIIYKIIGMRIANAVTVNSTPMPLNANEANKECQLFGPNPPYRHCCTATRQQQSIFHSGSSFVMVHWSTLDLAKQICNADDERQIAQSHLPTLLWCMLCLMFFFLALSSFRCVFLRMPIDWYSMHAICALQHKQRVEQQKCKQQQEPNYREFARKKMSADSKLQLHFAEEKEHEEIVETIRGHWQASQPTVSTIPNAWRNLLFL